MNLLQTYQQAYQKASRLIMIVTAGLFLFTQSFSVAHASAYGDTPHEHEGIACVVQVLNEDECAPLLETYVYQVEKHVFKDGFETPYRSFVLRDVQTRAPPPRAPPFSIS